MDSIMDCNRNYKPTKLFPPPVTSGHVACIKNRRQTKAGPYSYHTAQLLYHWAFAQPVRREFFYQSNELLPLWKNCCPVVIPSFWMSESVAHKSHQAWRRSHSQKAVPQSLAQPMWLQVLYSRWNIVGTWFLTHEKLTSFGHNGWK